MSLAVEDFAGANLKFTLPDTEDGSFHGQGVDGHNGFDRGRLATCAESVGFLEIRFTTRFRMTQGADPDSTEYPIFLMVARLPDQDGLTR